MLFRSIPYSQSFDNALWVKDSNGTGVTPSVTANNATAPDGTMTADTIVFNAGAGTTTGDSSVVYQSITLTGSATASFYARVTSGTGQLVFRGVSGATYTTANITTTWQRFSAAENGSSGFFEIGVRRGLANEPINASVTVEIWAAQLESGDIATDYIPTTSAAVSVGPVANLPRLDYLDSSCPKLLLEPQRTNLITYSESFSGWDIGGTIAVTDNSTTSPDGTQNAAKIEYDGSGGYTYFRTSYTAAVGVFSIYAKKGNWRYLGIRNNGGSSHSVWDFDTETFSNVQTNHTMSFDALGNGWYRIMDYVSVDTASPLRGVAITDTTGSESSPSVPAGSYVYLWGAQGENASSYATSYIPTLSAAATRGADSALKTGISSLIGQTEGTIYAEFQYYNNIAVGSGQYISPLTISNGSYTQAVYFEIFNDSLSAAVWATTSQASITKSDLTSGTHKAAIAYKQNDVAFYLDGILIGTDTSVNISTLMSQVNLGTIGAATSLDQPYRQTQALLFKTRLTNAELAALTTI